MLFTDDAALVVVAGVVLPALLISLVAVLALRLLALAGMDDNSNQKRWFVLTTHVLAIVSVISFLAADVVWLVPMLRSYPLEATVATQAAEAADGGQGGRSAVASAVIIDNVWWTQVYGDAYTVGDDGYIESFCVPHQQFALVLLEWKCPFTIASLSASTSPCRGSILAWDCGHREICQKDCTVSADDAVGRVDYQCDYLYDDDNNDSNGEQDGDDDGENDDQQQQQQTEDEMVQCAETLYSQNSKVNIIADCTECTAPPLTIDDYDWARKGHVDDSDSNVPLVLATVVGVLSGVLCMIFYYWHHADDTDKILAVATDTIDGNEQSGTEFHPID